MQVWTERKGSAVLYTLVSLDFSHFHRKEICLMEATEGGGGGRIRYTNPKTY